MLLLAKDLEEYNKFYEEYDLKDLTKLKLIRFFN